MKRCESLLRQLLQNLGFKITVEGSLIFINPEFTLYNSPQNQSIIFPTQLNRFMKKLNSKPSKLNEGHRKLAEQLVGLHQIESPYNRLRHYDYGQLRKGILCGSCHSFMVSKGGKELVCEKCGNQEPVESAVLRSIEEFNLLFPNKKITTSVIHEWCRVIESKKIIRKILNQNLNCVVKGKYCFYEK